MLISIKKTHPSCLTETTTIVQQLFKSYLDFRTIQKLNQDIYKWLSLEMYFKIEVKVTLKWFDSRLTFRNLKSSTFGNKLNKEEKGKIWIPELLFLNSKGYITLKARRGEHGEGIDGYIWVERRGSSLLNDLSDLNEDYLYPFEHF